MLDNQVRQVRKCHLQQMIYKIQPQ